MVKTESVINAKGNFYHWKLIFVLTSIYGKNFVIKKCRNKGKNLFNFIGGSLSCPKSTPTKAVTDDASLF